jgi:dephospho-CoA kinase
MGGYRFDEYGNAIPSNIYIVWGSPASGKTTYVRKHMDKGDLVVDLDLIKQSISLSNKTGAPDNLLLIAIKIRDMLYGMISRREFDCINVWVIAGLPKKKQREELRLLLKTDKCIYIEASKERCILQAMADDERLDKEMQRRIIDRWFDDAEL